MPDPAKEFEKVDDAVDKNLEKNIKPSDTAIIEQGKKRRAQRFNGQIKDLIAQRVATMDYLGFTKREAAKMLTDELYPNGEGEFTPKQYVHWLNNIKAAKLTYFDYYAKTGIVLDMIDINETMKMTYQNALREFRRECMKNKEGDRKDKGYIIKLGYLIKDLAEERQKILFSVPFVNSYKTVMARSKGVVDDIKQKYPSLLEVSNTGAISVRVSHDDSGDAGNGSTDNPESLDASATGEESGAAGSEGAIQSDSDDRPVPETDGATRTTASERIFG